MPAYLVLFGATIAIGAILVWIAGCFPRRRAHERTRRHRRACAATTAAAGLLFCVVIEAARGPAQPTRSTIIAAGCGAPAESADEAGAMLRDALPADARIASLELQGAELRVVIDTGEWTSSSGTEIRLHLGGVLKGLYQTAACMPGVARIFANLMTPLAEQRDEYGRELPAAQALFCTLTIPADDLRKFPDDFDWTMYGTYVANRYAVQVNPAMRAAWEAEAADENRLGGFISVNADQRKSPPGAIRRASAAANQTTQ